MEKDTENSKLRDMNGNSLRDGDLVMVLLEKPVLVGIVQLTTPSALLAKDKNPFGVIKVIGNVSIPFDPAKMQIMRQIAKLVDPRAEALVEAIASNEQVRRAAAVPLPEKEPAVESPAGPILVSDSKDKEA